MCVLQCKPHVCDSHPGLGTARVHPLVCTPQTTAAHAVCRPTHRQAGSFHPVFIQFSSSFHPVFIQFSSSFHPVFIQFSSSFHPVFIQFSSSFHLVFVQFTSNFRPVFLAPISVFRTARCLSRLQPAIGKAGYERLSTHDYIAYAVGSSDGHVTARRYDVDGASSNIYRRAS